MSFLGDWDDILESLAAQRKKYGGTSIGGSAALTASGKGFRFPDEATADKIAARFEARARSMKDRARLIRQAKDRLNARFSEDGASEGYRQQALASLNALDELNQSAYKYAANYAVKIAAVTTSKLGEDLEIGSSVKGLFKEV